MFSLNMSAKLAIRGEKGVRELWKGWTALITM